MKKTVVITIKFDSTVVANAFTGRDSERERERGYYSRATPSSPLLPYHSSQVDSIEPLEMHFSLRIREIAVDLCRLLEQQQQPQWQRQWQHWQLQHQKLHFISLATRAMWPGLIMRSRRRQQTNPR